MPRRPAGFTLLELIVVVAIAGVILALAAPSFYEYILVQRLKSVSAQLTTDLQFARSEAISHGSIGRVTFDSDDSVTCYTIYTVKPVSNAPEIRCDCLRGAGAACDDPDAIETRTVRVDRSTGVRVLATARDKAIGFDPVTGGLLAIPTDATAAPLNRFVIETRLDDTRLLRTTVTRSGKPGVCGSHARYGAPAC